MLARYPIRNAHASKASGNTRNPGDSHTSGGTRRSQGIPDVGVLLVASQSVSSRACLTFSAIISSRSVRRRRAAAVSSAAVAQSFMCFRA